MSTLSVSQPDGAAIDFADEPDISANESEDEVTKLDKEMDAAQSLIKKYQKLLKDKRSRVVRKQARANPDQAKRDNPWRNSVRKHNGGKKPYLIPSKDTPEYFAVLKLMEQDYPEAWAKRQAKLAKAAEKLKEGGQAKVAKEKTKAIKKIVKTKKAKLKE